MTSKLQVNGQFSRKNLLTLFSVAKN